MQVVTFYQILALVVIKIRVRTFVNGLQHFVPRRIVAFGAAVYLHSGGVSIPSLAMKTKETYGKPPAAVAEFGTCRLLRDERQACLHPAIVGRAVRVGSRP